jgi:hypothetical protein
MFERGIDPFDSLNIGMDRKIRKGDSFLMKVKGNPERRVIALEDEKSYQHRYIEKSGRYGEADEWDSYEVRQVKFEIPGVASGVAELRTNCEFPCWTFTDTPEFNNDFDD